MLYECWRRIYQQHASELALVEVLTGRRWTFRELAAVAEADPPSDSEVVFPTGQNVDFILSVLQAWRAGRVVCPLEPGQQTPLLTQLPPGGVVHLKTTSASTEASRMVAFTAAELSADARNIVETMGMKPEWPNVSLISLAHSYGFSNLVTPLLLHGIPLILAGGTLPESLRRAAQGFDEISISAVPALWRTWLDSGAIPENVRLAISAGAPLPLELEHSVHERHGLKIHNFYGSTECGGIAYDRSEKIRTDPGCTGEPMRNVEVKIADDGCLEVRGDAVGETYWPDPRPNLAGGVFRTSDLSEMKNGLVYLRGRACDQINVAGRKVLPEAIERVLSAHPQVHACLAFGVPGNDVQRGESIVACIAGERSLTPEELKQFVLARLPAWQVPRHWWFLEALETNERGKLSRAEWRRRFLETRVVQEK